MDTNNICPSCKYQTLPEWYFCPNCGKAIKEKAPSISIWKQLLIYFASFFFTPFGLVWGFKYIRYKDTKVKIVGIISILLTILSIILVITTFNNLLDKYSKTLNDILNKSSLNEIGL